MLPPQFFVTSSSTGDATYDACLYSLDLIIVVLVTGASCSTKWGGGINELSSTARPVFAYQMKSNIQIFRSESAHYTRLCFMLQSN